MGLALLTRHELPILLCRLRSGCIWNRRTSRQFRATDGRSRSWIRPAAAAWCALNIYRFGNALDAGYLRDRVPQFGSSIVTGIYGLLLSPTASLFVYCPIAIVAVAALLVLAPRDRAAAILFGGSVLVLLLFYAQLGNWMGGRSYGPRYLVPVIPLAHARARGGEPLATSSRRDGRRRLLLAISLAVQVPGVLVDYAKVSVAHARANGAPTPDDRLFNWRVSPLVLNTAAALSDAAQRRLADWARRAAAAGARRCRATLQSDFSQQFADTLDFWWMYLLRMGVASRTTVRLLLVCMLAAYRRAWPALSATDGDREMSSRRQTLLLVVLAMALGAWLRLRGISFGLPAVYNPDEVVDHVARAGVRVGRSQSAQLPLPDALLLLACSPGSVRTSSAAWIVGAIPSVAAFQQSFFLDPTAFTSRDVCCRCCAASRPSLACGDSGSRIWSAAAGLAAAFFLAVAPFAVRDAHYVKHDVPDDGGAGRSVPGDGLRCRSRADQPDRDGCGSPRLLAGLATSMHYYAVFIGAATCNRRVGGLAGANAWRARLRRIAKAAAIAALAFFLGSPFLLAEPLTAIRDIRANRQIVIDRAVESASRWFPSATDYARMLAIDADWLADCTPRGHWRRRSVPEHARAWHGCSCPSRSRSSLFISNTVAATRYVNAVLPFVAIAAGIGVSAVGAAIADARTRAAAVTAVTMRGGLAGPGGEPSHRHVLQTARHSDLGARVSRDPCSGRCDGPGAAVFRADDAIARGSRSRR